MEPKPIAPATSFVSNPPKASLRRILTFFGRNITYEPQAFKKCDPVFQLIMGSKGDDLQDELFRQFKDINSLLSLRRCSKAVHPFASLRTIQIWNDHFVDLQPSFLNTFMKIKLHESLRFAFYFKRLEALNLSYGKIVEDKAFNPQLKRAVKALSHLRTVNLTYALGGPIEVLLKLPHLETLSLSNCTFEKSTFIEISQKKTLKNLHFYDCFLFLTPDKKFTCNPLTKLPLKSLTIQGGYLADEDFAFLNKMTTLNYLNLLGHIFNHGYKHFTNLVNLNYLACPLITTKEISHMPNLKYLKLQFVNKEHLALQCSQMTQLKLLDITEDVNDDLFKLWGSPKLIYSGIAFDGKIKENPNKKKYH